ncbi:MAG: CinA family protein [Bacillota bacterium]
MYKQIRLVSTKQYIEDTMKEACPNLSYALRGECMDYVISIDSEQEDICDVLDAFEEEIYSTDGKGLAETLVETLLEEELIIATAESCTGGMIASSIVSVPNASNVFGEGIVSYSNQAKIDRLGVDSNTLDLHGAVSKETAIEMVNGLIENGANIAVATTGIAGPTGGSEEKPVGLVYIAVCSEESSEVHRMEFTGDRQQIRQQASNCAMHFAIQHILNLSDL